MLAVGRRPPAINRLPAYCEPLVLQVSLVLLTGLPGPGLAGAQGGVPAAAAAGIGRDVEALEWYGAGGGCWEGWEGLEARAGCLHAAHLRLLDTCACCNKHMQEGRVHAASMLIARLQQALAYEQLLGFFHVPSTSCEVSSEAVAQSSGGWVERGWPGG